jgi:excinuclease ABC subunit C
MPIRDLKDQIARLPQQPGVYLYFNQAGETIYVGKARTLRDRVRSYLGAYGLHPKTDALLDEADRLEVIVTDSVMEALALENHLIKQRSPRYNVLLRDDKNYPYLQLTTSEAFPRILVARRVERDGNYYAGPFLPASLGRKTIDLTHRLFGLRSCNEVITGQRGRPCLEHDIKRCIAPCVAALCAPEEYQRAVGDARLFLEGRSDELLSDLHARMEESAQGERYEQAAQVRDSIRTIETLRDRQQKMVTTRLGDRDAFGIKLGPSGGVVQVFQVRRGRVVDRVELATDAPASASAALAASAAVEETEDARADGDETVTGAADVREPRVSRGPEAEVLEAALQQFYQDQQPPPEIHVPIVLDDAEVIEAWLSERAGRKVRLLVPKRGDKRGLLDLATRNAKLAYDARAGGASKAGANYEALELLRAALSLAAMPRRIECFDISTIQGSETVASMVVCEDGRMKRGEYRKFRIRGNAPGAADATRTAAASAAASGAAASGSAASAFSTGAGAADIAAAASVSAATPGMAAAPARARSSPRDIPGRVLDDFASMHEVVLRRYKRVVEAGGPFPDLVIIDGGKGQLSAAYEALRALGLEQLVAVGLAKQEELIFTRDSPDAIAFPHDSPALRLLQRIRDEAHRFAITYHRQSRTQRDLRSELDDVPGIGPRRRRQLLRTFGSLSGVRRATREELTSIVGAKVADAVLQHFAGQ